MDIRPFVVTPNEYPRAFRIVGERITVLASGAETNAYELFLQQGPGGSGPPPHSHQWDESFYVTRGQIEFGIGDESLTASVGTLVHLPAGMTHWFRFGEAGGEMISMTSRLGASRMFAEMDRDISPERPDLAKLVGIANRHGMTVVT